MHKKATFISTLSYIGHSPLMPGTIGALAGLFVYFLVKKNVILYGFSAIFLFALGVLFSGEAEKIYKHKDPRVIVIDEACGMLLTLAFLPYHLLIVALGFLFFRLFDIFKPWPARALEKLPGGWGIMADDVVAALYANVILQVMFRILPAFK